MARKGEESNENMGYYHYKSVEDMATRLQKMRGPRRVITFCLLTVFLPSILLIIPLYLRHVLYGDVVYSIGAADVFLAEQGISSVWCQEQSLKMNASFNAYMIDWSSEISKKNERVKIERHMKLADDELEYQGIFMLRGSNVTLSMCSRFEGARLMVVNGEHNLEECALLKHSPEPEHRPLPVLPSGGDDVTITFDKDLKDVQKTTPPSTTNKSKVTRPDLEDEESENTAQEDLEDDVEVKDYNDIDGDDEEREKVDLDYDDEEEEEEDPEDDVDDDENLENAGRGSGYKYSNNHFRPPKDRKRHALHNEKHAQLHTHNKTAENNPPDDSSTSSFENSLVACYGGHIVFSHSFSPSQSCKSAEALKGQALAMKINHDIKEDGFYYYIFYSDNDITSNDIYATFDVQKVIYDFDNVTEACRNKMECTLGLDFLSSQRAYIEIPSKNKSDDGNIILVSVCKPRMAVYIVFPIAVMFLILGCAFL